LLLVGSFFDYENRIEAANSLKPLAEHAEVATQIITIKKVESPFSVSRNPELLRRVDDAPQPLADEQWADRLSQEYSLSPVTTNDAAPTEKIYHTNPKMKDLPLQSPFYDLAEEFQKWGWEDDT
jgi:hypothetical protein